MYAFEYALWLIFRMPTSQRETHTANGWATPLRPDAPLTRVEAHVCVRLSCVSSEVSGDDAGSRVRLSDYMYKILLCIL